MNNTNSFRYIGAGTNFLSPTDFILEVDTSNGDVEIVLPKIETILNNATIYQYIGIRFVDISNNASVNNITLTGFENNNINGLDSVVLNTNGIGGTLTLIGDNEWIFTENKITSISPTVNYGLYSQTSSSSVIIKTSLKKSLIGTGVGTLSVPVNSFSIGDSFVAKIGGKITNLNNTNITFKVESLGVVLIDTGLIQLKVGTNQFWQLEVNFTIRNIGGTDVASIISNGSFTHIRNNNVVDVFGFNTINNTTFDTTILNTLDITAQWQTADEGNSMYSEYFVLNKIY